MNILQFLKSYCTLSSRFVYAIAALLVFTQINLAAGAVDPTFVASVTEGVGFVGGTLTQPNGKIISFGGFQKANTARFGNIVRFNPDGTLDATFNATGTGANALISSAALQTDGKIIIGGTFTAFNGQTRIHLARLNANGSLDSSFTPTEAFNPTNNIYDIAIQADGKILVSNAFLTGSMTPLPNRMMRFNPDGSTDSTFQNSLTYNQNINSIVSLPDNKILVGGLFTNIGGTQKSFLARLNSDGTLDNTFSASVSGSGVNKILIQPNGKILIAGDYLSNGIRRLNADGSQETAAAKPNASASVVEAGYDVKLQPDGKVLVAYGFGSSGNITSYTIIRLNADLTIDGDFPSPAFDRFPITDINLLASGKFIASGSFVALNDNPSLRYLVQMNADGSHDSAFNPVVSSIGRITAVKRQSDGKILVGGNFEFVGGERHTNVARLNPDGSLDDTFNTPPALFAYISNSVFDIELQSDGKILVGRFRLSGATIARSEASGVYQGSIIRLNPNGSLDESFGTMTTHWINGITVSSDNKIFIGGNIENLQIPPFGTEGFRKLMPDGEMDTTFNITQQPQAGSVYESVSQPDGKVLISGNFTTVGGNPRVGTARYNADGTLDATYTGALPSVLALGLASDGKIYAGGNFPISGGNPNTNLARLKTDGSIDPTFVGTANARVRDLIVQPDGKILIGGDFTNYYSNPVGRIARVNTNGSIDPRFNTGAGASGNVYALERQPDGKILVGGQFLDFDGVERFSIARLLAPNAIAPFDFDGDLKTDLSIFRPSVGEWWYLRSSDGQNRAFQFGNSADKLTPADFTGDGKTDIAIWRPSVGVWFILRSEDDSFYAFPFGTTGDIPATGDFDADSKADATIFRPSEGTWYVNRSSTGATTIQQFGQSGDVPVAADYDGDGMSDIAIYRPAVGEWWIQRSAAGLIAFQFGNSADKAVQGDFTGDGKADAAIWRPTTGEWFILRSEDLSYYSFPFGASGDVPAPGDYDGDGKFDAGIFRPSSSTWYVQRTTAGTLIQTFGTTGDLPVPNAFVP